MTAVNLQAGNALNDLATCDKFSYQSGQDAVSLITPGCWMYKADLARAYQSVKLHSHEPTISGLEWNFKGRQSVTYLDV